MTKTHNWKSGLARYMKPSPLKSNTQLTITLACYFLCWLAAYLSYGKSILGFTGAIILGSGFVIRIFIIMHDCVHGSFYSKKKWNKFWGFVCGVLTFSSFQQWSRTHLYHHKSTGNLDDRGIGDFETLTVDEYKKLSTWKKIRYRIIRNPLMFLIPGPLLIFFIYSRFYYKGDTKKEKRDVLLTNLAILLFGAIVCAVSSFGFYLIFQFLSIYIAAMIGIALFYVQHQYKNPYWRKKDSWNNMEASLSGSSYLKLPRIFQWFTGNIGYHHIHHLCPGIPNYNLEEVYKNTQIFQNCTVLTLRSCISCFFLSLYDVKTQELISFREYRRRYAA